MKNIKKDIPAIARLLGTTAFALATGGMSGIVGGVMSSTLKHMASGVIAHFITDFTPDKINKWFKDVHPNDLNHHIKKLFVKSINEALDNIYVLFTETQASKKEKKEARQLINDLQKRLPDILLDSNQIQLDEAEIKHFLYDKDKEEAICRFIEDQFKELEISDLFKTVLSQNLPAQIQLCFGEGLKDPSNQDAWVAFQRMLTEEIRNDIKQIADTQQSIKDDLSDLKFEKSGFSEEQIGEIRQFVKILNNKKLIEVKIKSGLNKSLQSIESKANEIIKITTKTQLTVDELKTIVIKIKQQNRINQIIIYALSGCLLISISVVAYKLMNQPFTATVQIYGWENRQHNPLNGKGTLVLTLGDKTEKAEISRQGEAFFKGIMPEYNGKSVQIHITDTEGEPYYLPDSIINIRKNNITNVLVLLQGLEKLEGTIYDNVSGEGLPDVSVALAGIKATTNENGVFIIDIPIEKQRKEQEIEISKAGYKSKRQTIPMAGEHKYRTVLERN